MNYCFDNSILSVAEDFYNAYQRCLEGKNTHVDESNVTVSEIVCIPAIVNGAFSIELFLKSLSPLSNKELRKKKHELAELFLTLDQEDQTIIREAVEKEMNDYSFEDGLRIINNSFTFWRYIHLKKSYGFPGVNVTHKLLDIFLGVIREHALKKKKKDKLVSF